MKIIGHVIPHTIPESIKAILKIKEDTLFFSVPLEFCKENKINPENLEFDIFKDSDKIMLVAQNGLVQTETENHTPIKMEASNVTK